MPHIEVALADAVDACFSVDTTPRATHASVGASGNLAHHRPHHPDDLHAARQEVGLRSRTNPAHWHLMSQIHSAQVAVVTDDMLPGVLIRNVDALATQVRDRTLGVFTADCLPVLIAGSRGIAAVHAGRAGIAQRILTNTVSVLRAMGESPENLHVAIGPAIGGCCYELPQDMVTAFVAHTPTAKARTTWGTASLDLVAAAHDELARAGVTTVSSVGICTACDTSWFSHRRDPNAGRAIALITRRGE